jgi:hypothetical protein
MSGGEGRHAPSFAQCPALIPFYLRREVVMHKVPLRLSKLIRWSRMWIGVSDCGVMCFPEGALPESAAPLWCIKCFPAGFKWL